MLKAKPKNLEPHPTQNLTQKAKPEKPNDNTKPKKKLNPKPKLKIKHYN